MYRRYEYCILNKLSQYLRYIYICINKHGKALSSISAHPPSTYAQRFSEQTDEKNPCLAVFSVVFKMADTNARVLPMSAVQTTEPTSETRGDGHVMYRIVTTVSGYISYRGEMYCIVAGLILVSIKVVECF